MVESSTVMLIAFFGVAIVGTPYALKWFSDRSKGTNSEQESYEKYQDSSFGKFVTGIRKPIDNKLNEYQKFIDYNKGKVKVMW